MTLKSTESWHLWQVGFCTPSHTKCLFSKLQTTRFITEKHKKKSLETSMKKDTYFGPRCKKSSQNEVPKCTKIYKNQSLDPRVSFRVSPGLPGSPPWSPGCQNGGTRLAKWQVWEPKVSMFVSKRTVMVIKSNTFQQNKLENNYLETNIQKDNYFCPAPCQFCMSCQSKSAGKPTSKPVRKPDSQPADQQVASQQASKPASPQLSKGAGGRGEALR